MPNFACIPRLNYELIFTQFVSYDINSGLMYSQMDEIAEYVQYPPFLSKKHCQKGPILAFSSQIYKQMYYQNYCSVSNQNRVSDKGFRVLFVRGPKMCLTNPGWQTAAILSKMADNHQAN